MYMVRIYPKAEINVWTKFWLLTVLYETKNRHWNRIIVCRCACWNITNSTVNWLLKQWAESCWCKQYADMKINNTIHWLSWGRKWKNPKIYNVYFNIKTRCNCKKSSDYKDYGWRWITFSWKNFQEFKDDMYESYLKHVEEFWEKNTEIDRIDVNWNYCKENCRWVTEKEQSRNKRTNKRINYYWEVLCVTDVANKIWVDRRKLHKLYDIFWDDIEVLLSKI